VLSPIVLAEETLTADDAHEAVRERLRARVFDKRFAKGQGMSLMPAIDRTRIALAGLPDN